MRQLSQLQALGFQFNQPHASPDALHPTPVSQTDARIAEAAEYLRHLHESGETDRSDVSQQAAYEASFMDDLDDHCEDTFEPLAAASCRAAVMNGGQWGKQ